MITNKGVCSITFRGLKVKEFIELVKNNNLHCIEWGGDIHVPSNDIRNAIEVGKLTKEKGLEIFSYGSYFRCDSVNGFKAVSQTAKALGAKIIRVWAGNKDAGNFTQNEFNEFVNIIKSCALIAKDNEQIIAFEYHYGTYNNSAENSLKLLSAINCDNVKTYWQPMYWNKYENDDEEIQANIDSINKMKAEIVCVHVYSWLGTNRLAFYDGIAKWKKYIEVLPNVCGYLEFVKDDKKEQFELDAKYFLEI